MADLESLVRAGIRDVPDFPTKGVLFKDITPVLADSTLLHAIVDRIAADYEAVGVDLVAGIESRGFLFAMPVAMTLKAGFIPIRKPGKLPHETIRAEYALEYGTDALEAHRDAVRPGQRILLIDDVLATGGTAAAGVQLIRQLGGEVVGAAFVLELLFLQGRQKLANLPVSTIVQYTG